MSKIVGGTWKPLATFTDADGALYDPDLVTARVQAPDGSVSTPATSTLGTGLWSTLISLDQAGFWFADITGQGPDGEVVIVRGTVCVLPELVATS